MIENPFPIILTKTAVLFNRIQLKPNGLPVRVEIEELITPKGLVLPIGFSGLSGLDCLSQGVRAFENNNFGTYKFLTIDRLGKVVENTSVFDDQDNRRLFSSKRVVYSDVYVRGETHDSEVLGMVSWLIAKGDLEKVAQLLPTIDRSLHCDFEIVPLSGIRSLIRTAAREESIVV